MSQELHSWDKINGFFILNHLSVLLTLNYQLKHNLVNQKQHRKVL